MKRYVAVLVSGLVLSAGVLVSGPAEAAPAKFIPAQGKAIPNQYIVVLKDGPSIHAGSVAQSVNARPQYVYDAALNGFAATLNPGQLKALQNNPNVAYIEQDAEVSIETTQPGISIETTQSGATWGLDRIDQRYLPLNGTYNYNITASNVTAYVIDTGIYTAHSDFGGRATVAYDAFGGNGQDCNGHGTHVAGILGGARYGVAKSVKLRSVRVFDCNGSGTWSGIIAGMNWVAANVVSPSVVSISLSGGTNTSVDTAASAMAKPGVAVTVAAGDSNADACNFSPARASGVLTVAASTSTDARASFSNYGPCVEIYAPGGSITSTWLNGGTNTLSGTSLSASHAAGVAALFLAYNPAPAIGGPLKWIIDNATPNVITGNPPNTPNLLLYKSNL